MLMYVDLLGKKPKLFVDKAQKYKTSLGGIFSILGLLVIGTFSIYFLYELISRKRANIMYNKLIDPVPSTNLTEYPFVFGIVDGTTHPFTNPESLFSLVPDIDQFEKCDINKHFGNYSSYFKDVYYLKNHYCLPYNKHEIFLSGVVGGVGYRYLNIDIRRCINSTTPDATGQIPIGKCVDYNTWYQKMTSSYIYYGYLDYTIDHNDLNKPNKLVFKSAFYQITSTLFKRYYISRKNVNYTTDMGFLVEENSVINFSQYDSVDTSIDLRTDAKGKFAQVSFVMSGNVDDYYRSYTKLQTTIANIGGVIKSVIFAANFIVSYLNYKRYYCDLGSLIDISEESFEQESIKKINTEKEEIPMKVLKPITEISEQIKVKKERQKSSIMITFKDLILPTICLSKQNEIKKCIERFHTLLSIDYILKKFIEYDNILGKPQRSNDYNFCDHEINHPKDERIKQKSTEKNNFIRKK